MARSAGVIDIVGNTTRDRRSISGNAVVVSEKRFSINPELGLVASAVPLLEADRGWAEARGRLADDSWAA
jgi:hypothetical protein